MDTGAAAATAAAAAFSPPIFRPALPSFTWQTPRATFGVLIVRQRRSLRSLLSLLRLSATIVSSRSEYAFPFLLPPPNTRAFPHFPPFPLAPSPFETTRVYDRNSFTCSSPVTQRNVAFLPGLSGDQMRAGTAGISDGIRIFDPFSLSLSFSCALYLCLLFAYLRASIEKKTRQLDCLLLKKKSDGEFYEASPYLRGIKG